MTTTIVEHVTHLEERLRRLSEALRHADRLAMVGKLAARLAHEIGTPLTIIAGHARMIIGSEVGHAGAVESARIIDRQTDRVAQLVRQLLDYARNHIADGGVVEVLGVAKTTVGLLTPLALERAIQLCVVGREAVASIDEQSLRQVLANVIVNAIQASSAGGAVTVTIEPAVAAPSGGAERDVVQIDIRDHGTGMADDVAARIFEPFFTTKQYGEGTGLGLSVVEEIVQDHGGWIAVTTAVERGTTFSVFVPSATGGGLEQRMQR